MLSAVFRHTSRAPALPPGMSDASNIRWTFVGKGREQRGRMFYNAARVRLIDQEATRIFQVGDCVFVGTEGSNEKWVAHIVKFMDLLGEDGERSTDAECMRVILRWFYKPKDIHEKTSLSNIKEPEPNELYWSDHVEIKGNPVECIEGRAFVRKHRKDVLAVRANPPPAFWPGDRFYLCRYYYGTDEPDPPPLRAFGEHELAYLLQNPSAEELFRSAMLYQRRGHKLKHDDDGTLLMSARKHSADPATGSSGGSSSRPDLGSERPYFTCICNEETPGTESPKKALVDAGEASEGFTLRQDSEEEGAAKTPKTHRVRNITEAKDIPMWLDSEEESIAEAPKKRRTRSNSKAKNNALLYDSEEVSIAKTPKKRRVTSIAEAKKIPALYDCEEEGIVEAPTKRRTRNTSKAKVNPVLESSEEDSVAEAPTKRHTRNSAKGKESAAKRPRVTNTVIDGGHFGDFDEPSTLVQNASAQPDSSARDTDMTVSNVEEPGEEGASLGSMTRSKTKASPPSVKRKVDKLSPNLQVKEEQVVDELEELFDAPPPSSNEYTFGLPTQTKIEEGASDMGATSKSTDDIVAEFMNTEEFPSEAQAADRK